MRILVAPQEYKGRLTARAAADAMARALRAVCPHWSLDLAPVADGGPGTLEALCAAQECVEAEVPSQDPLGRPLLARYGALPDGWAIVEMAQASGLWRLRREERNAGLTSTFGTGQLIAAALQAGHTRVLIGVGGSATNDGGAGALTALGFRFLDAAGQPLPPGGVHLERLHAIDDAAVLPAARTAQLRVATDVQNVLLGSHGATFVYGPQKGADPALLQRLERALTRFSEVVTRHTGRDDTSTPATGAAGGLSFGLHALLGAELVPGFAEVARALRLDARIARADLVLTGEGRLDAQTAYGKGPSELAARAQKAGLRIVCFAGKLDDAAAARRFDEVVEVSRERVPRPDEAADVLEQAVRAWARRLA